MKIKEIKARWLKPFPLDQLQRISEYAKLESNLFDLRGVSMERNSIRNIDLVGVDFSYSSFSSMAKLKLENCFLNKFKLEDTLYEVNVTNTVFVNGKIECDFIDCNIVNSIFNNVNFAKSSIIARNKFINCKFINCSFKRLNGQKAIFDNCIFVNNEVNDWTTFYEASFIKCDLQEQNFENAIMDKVNFNGCYLRPEGGV